jgi:hypothetical protein
LGLSTDGPFIFKEENYMDWDAIIKEDYKWYVNSLYGRACYTDGTEKIKGYDEPLSRKRTSYSNITKVAYKAFHPFAIEKVIFNDPATIVMWKDGTKTVVKCNEGDTYDPEKGLAMAISKKALGNKGNYYNTFTEWLPEEEEFNAEEFEEFNAEEFWDNLKNILLDKVSSYPIPPLQIINECVDCYNHSAWEPQESKG